MNILIKCDQKDYIHNAGNTVHHDHNNDVCTHHLPFLWKRKIERVCSSKETKVK